ncbi:ABC transporter substrate-binding protein [Bifidobacterium goeldii]|uniref:ABC transporter substrate-binding protein n=1 Tax=Bifidobacterium goeldii TaxID=2306975 RepID=A0A430FN88_9BIFI|nr:sugar ABC transporter substrate-binding protein [Bifidobacterium goeldii]RSX54303.1 ABC transporter substrate-binding protein [Bifidobacterium goeldii]
MKHVTGTKVTAAALAVLMGVGLAACGSSSGANGPEGTADDPVEINVWAWEPTLKQATAAFEKANPGIKVKLTNVGSAVQTITSLTNAINAGSGAPDVAQFEYHALPQFALAGSLADMSDMGAKDYDGFYTPGTWAQVNSNGGIYGLPMDSGPTALFYNKEVFDAAGVTEPPKTWDEYYEAAKKIKALGGGHYITADTGSEGSYTILASLIWAAGGRPYEIKDAENVSITLASDPAVKKVADFWQKMIDEDLINTKVNSWSDDWNRGLGDGTIASLNYGAWMSANLLTSASQASGKFRVATIPQWDESKPSNGEAGGSTLAIMASSEKQKAAWKYIDFVNHEREGIDARVDNGSFPSDLETLKSEKFLNGSDQLTEYFGGQEYNKVLAQAASEVSEGFSYMPFSAHAMSIYGDNLGPAYRKEVTLSQALANFQKALTEYGESQGFTVTN